MKIIVHMSRWSLPAGKSQSHTVQNRTSHWRSGIVAKEKYLSLAGALCALVMKYTSCLKYTRFVKEIFVWVIAQSTWVFDHSSLLPEILLIANLKVCMQNRPGLSGFFFFFFFLSEKDNNIFILKGLVNFKDSSVKFKIIHITHLNT